MITSIRRCVACADLWPWPISSRSFDLDFENRVRSVTLSVLDRLFHYHYYFTTIISLPLEGVSRVKFITKFWNFNFSLIFRLSPWKKIYNSAYILSIFFWLGIWYESIVWVIMGRWGVFSERRRSSCSSYFYVLFHTNPCLLCFMVIIVQWFQQCCWLAHTEYNMSLLIATLKEAQALGKDVNVSDGMQDVAWFTLRKKIGGKNSFYGRNVSLVSWLPSEMCWAVNLIFVSLKSSGHTQQWVSAKKT